jgi:hypothetical protein
MCVCVCVCIFLESVPSECIQMLFLSFSRVQELRTIQDACDVLQNQGLLERGMMRGEMQSLLQQVAQETVWKEKLTREVKLKKKQLEEVGEQNVVIKNDVQTFIHDRAKELAVHNSLLTKVRAQESHMIQLNTDMRQQAHAQDTQISELTAVVASLTDQKRTLSTRLTAVDEELAGLRAQHEREPPAARRATMEEEARLMREDARLAKELLAAEQDTSRALRKQLFESSAMKMAKNHEDLITKHAKLATAHKLLRKQHNVTLKTLTKTKQDAEEDKALQEDRYNRLMRDRSSLEKQLQDLLRTRSLEQKELVQFNRSLVHENSVIRLHFNELLHRLDTVAKRMKSMSVYVDSSRKVSEDHRMLMQVRKRVCEAMCLCVCVHINSHACAFTWLNIHTYMYMNSHTPHTPIYIQPLRDQLAVVIDQCLLNNQKFHNGLATVSHATPNAKVSECLVLCSAWLSDVLCICVYVYMCICVCFCFTLPSWCSTRMTTCSTHSSSNTRKPRVTCVLCRQC